MTIKVRLEDLEPNPYRDTEKYPVDIEIVNRLKKSITETKFWDNINGRKKPGVEGKYEMSCGMHRYVALMELGYEEINLIVRDYSDLDMLKIMIRENEGSMHTRSVKHINESVEKAKQAIEKAINDVNGVWKDLPEWCRELFDGEEGFERGVGQNKADAGVSFVGREIILKFLGSEWKSQTVQQALQALAESITVTEKNEDGEIEKIPVKISRIALEKFEVPKQAEAVTKVFKSEVGRSAFPTKESQEKAVNKVIETLQDEGTEDISKVSSPIINAYLTREAEAIAGNEFKRTQKPKIVTTEEISRIIDEPKHIEAVTEVFQSKEGRIAFIDEKSRTDTYKAVTKEIREESPSVITEDEEISPEMIKRKLKSKAYQTISEAEPFAEDEILSSEAKSVLGKNRSYFTKSRANFRTYTMSPYDIPLYKDEIAEKDYFILLGDIGERVRLLKEYESYLGIKPQLEKTVYEFYDRVDDEYRLLEDTWKDVEHLSDPELTIEEWCKQDITDKNVLDRLRGVKI